MPYNTLPLNVIYDWGRILITINNIWGLRKSERKKFVFDQQKIKADKSEYNFQAIPISNLSLHFVQLSLTWILCQRQLTLDCE